MKKLFLRKLGKLSDNITRENADNGRIFGIVYGQCGGFADVSERRKRRFNYRAVLAAFSGAVVLGGIAAVTVTRGGLFIAPASETDVSDISENLQTVPEITETAETAETAYTTFAVPVRGSDIQVTLKDYSFTNSGKQLEITIGVEDLSGNPLAFRDARGELSENPLWFGNVKMRSSRNRDYMSVIESLDIYKRECVTGTVGRQTIDDIVLAVDASKPPIVSEDRFLIEQESSYAFADYVVDDGLSNKADIKFTIVFTEKETQSFDDFKGETLYLTITDLLQNVFSYGVNMNADLSDMANKFGDSAVLIQTGFTGTLKEGGNASSMADFETIDEIFYDISNDSGTEIPFGANEYANDYTMTNALVKDGTLYLRGIINNYAGWIPQFSLRNTKTGEYLQGGCGGGDGYADGICRFNGCIKGVNSIEELKDYELILNYGDMRQRIAEGVWEFEIPVN